MLSSYDSAAYGSDVVLESRDGRVLVSGVGLIGERAYTGLEAEAKVTYNAGLFEVEVVVTDPRQEDIQCARAEFSVAPLNP
ncbi:hypothetical protein SDC9_91524 [bioreactor metagenome]|uniref:Uncharacterized protein n=1 Tax=bioreactor metagenome TaxID=1076179 RepID=A0A644ZVH8_9ZZZZ